jgi:hypothetical protein
MYNINWINLNYKLNYLMAHILIHYRSIQVHHSMALHSINELQSSGLVFIHFLGSGHPFATSLQSHLGSHSCDITLYINNVKSKIFNLFINIFYYIIKIILFNTYLFGYITK